MYEVKTDLVEYETDTLENSINFTREDDDIFLGLKLVLMKH